MGRVSQFAVQNTIYTDTRIPVQYRGGGNPNGQRGIPFSVVQAAIKAYIEGLPSYASNAAAITAGLVTGEMYWTRKDADGGHDELPGNILTRVY